VPSHSIVSVVYLSNEQNNSALPQHTSMAAGATLGDGLLSLDFSLHPDAAMSGGPNPPHVEPSLMDLGDLAPAAPVAVSKSTTAVAPTSSAAGSKRKQPDPSPTVAGTAAAAGSTAAAVVKPAPKTMLDVFFQPSAAQPGKDSSAASAKSVPAAASAGSKALPSTATSISSAAATSAASAVTAMSVKAEPPSDMPPPASKASSPARARKRVASTGTLCAFVRCRCSRL